MATQAEIFSILTALAAAHPKFELRKATVAIYTELLADLDASVLKAVTLQCAMTSRFFPTIAEIRDAALAISRPAVPSAYEAWAAVQVELRNVRRYALDYEPDLDPLTLRAVECVGGLADLRHTSSRVADRARFIEAYQVLAARQEWEARLLPQVRDLRRRLLVEGAQREAQALLEGSGHEGHIQDG